MAADEPEPAKKREEPPPLEFMKPGEPQTSPPPADQPPAAWVPGAEEYQRRATWQRAPTPATTPGRFSRLAGIVLILAGVLGIAASIYQYVNLPSVAEYANFTLNNSAETVAFSQVCALLSIWSQLAALLGGVMALQRLNWRLTLVCAVLAPLSLGFTLEASFLGALGLILVLRARNEFVS